MEHQDEPSRGDQPDSSRDLEGAGATRRPEFHDPAPVPTAFGATTVGGAVAASAMASGRPADELDPREEGTVSPGDGAVEDQTEHKPHDR